MDTRVEQISKQQWQILAPEFQDYNYRHLWEYGIALARRRGASCEHVAVRRGDEFIALADVRIKRLPLLGGGIAYVSGGPLTRRAGAKPENSLSVALEALVAEYSHRRGCVLRILAPLGSSEWNTQAAEQFRATGFGRTLRSAAYRTLVVNIDRPLEVIRSGLAQKWRNCLNAAERNGLTLRSGSDDAIFSEFCELFRDFHSRKGFQVNLDADFYKDLQRDLDENERLRIILAEQNGRIVAGHVSSMLGDTCVYLLGASDEEGLKIKAAYLLQWNAILTAKASGMSSYDLGGIDPHQNPNVYHFKAGLRGTEVSSAGPFEYRCANWRSALTLRAERVHRSMNLTAQSSRPKVLST
jgi:hypothetical protein